MMRNQPKEITLATLEVVVMPNGEVICLGQTIGWFDGLWEYLTPVEKPNEHE